MPWSPAVRRWAQTHYQLHAIPVLDEDGEPRGATAALLPRPKDESVGQHRERKLAALDRSNAVIEFEPDDTILHANDNFATVGGDILDRLPPEMLQQLAELLQSIPKAS